MREAQAKKQMTSFLADYIFDWQKKSTTWKFEFISSTQDMLPTRLSSLRMNCP